MELKKIAVSLDFSLEQYTRPSLGCCYENNSSMKSFIYMVMVIVKFKIFVGIIHPFSFIAAMYRLKFSKRELEGANK